MNPGTYYSAASLLNPRAKQKENKLSNGRSKPITSLATVPNAHALLNPKGSKTAQNTVPTSSEVTSKRPFDAARDFSPSSHVSPIQPNFVFSSTDKIYSDDEAMEDSSSTIIGQGTFLNRTHNVEDRSAQQAKRQKLSADSGSSWAANKGASDVSQHMKDKRLEGSKEVFTAQHEASNGRKVVEIPDDSEEDGEDDAESENDEAKAADNDTVEVQEIDPIVCIGQVDGAQINMDKIPYPSKNVKALSKNTWPAHKIKLVKTGVRDMKIVAFDEQGNDFGTLGAKWAYSISLALNGGKITELKAILQARKRKDTEAPGQLTSQTAAVHLFVYCLKSKALGLFKQLEKAKTPLRRPLGSDEHLEKLKYYDVEQELYEGDVHFMANAKVDPAALERLEHDVFDVLNQLPVHDDLPMMQEDGEYIETRLKDHQRQALQFMTEQEEENMTLLQENDPPTGGANGRSLWRVRTNDKGDHQFLNRATGHVQKQAPYNVLGGLLADQMGLGKTLTIIALIASTIDKAEDWCQTAETGEGVLGQVMVNVRTTLVVAPTTVLQNWEEQLKNHVVGNSLKTLKYHGTNRLQDAYELTDFDIIFTTYGTIASELRSGQPRAKRLASLFTRHNFWRIVLDEAHAIKSSQTERAAAIFSLNAERRWAVTGTPIQNGLEDFGSILKFLRIAPFDKQFKQLVTIPAKKDPGIVLGRMRLVFNSITLRRTKDKLNLPANNKYTEKVVLREDERRIYDEFIRAIQRSIKDIAQEDLGRNYMTFLSQLLSCRRICDSSDLLSDKERAALEGCTKQGTIDVESALDVVPSLTTVDAYRQLNALHEVLAANCSRCGTYLVKEPFEELEGDAIGMFWDCQCFICPDCSTSFKQDVDAATQGDKFVCPETDILAKVKAIKLTYKGFIAYRQAILDQEKQGTGKVAQRYTQASSKTEALLKKLNEERNKPTDHGLPNKAVVFTYWSGYLDLLQIDLEKAGYRYLRLDGSVSQSKRVKILAQFDQDPEYTVLIATIGVGGVGLNLQVANSVFIMEPQWNPAAEEQAVDRVHRIGQLREVTTVRFLVEDSVEMGVRAMAQQKQALADLTTSKNKLKRSDVSAKVQELLNVLQRR